MMGPGVGPSTGGTTATLRKKRRGCHSERSSALSSDDATSIGILGPAALAQVGRRISPAAVWRARDVERICFLRNWLMKLRGSRALATAKSRCEAERPRPLQY